MLGAPPKASAHDTDSQPHGGRAWPHGGGHGGPERVEGRNRPEEGDRQIKFDNKSFVCDRVAFASFRVVEEEATEGPKGRLSAPEHCIKRLAVH